MERPQSTQGHMEYAPPESMEIEARLRRLNLEIWNDVRRELQSHGEWEYRPHDADAVGDLLMDLNLALIDRDIEDDTPPD
jgi:hypothetical protein